MKQQKGQSPLTRKLEHQNQTTLTPLIPWLDFRTSNSSNSKKAPISKRESARKWNLEALGLSQIIDRELIMANCLSGGQMQGVRI